MGGHSPTPCGPNIQVHITQDVENMTSAVHAERLNKIVVLEYFFKNDVGSFVKEKSKKLEQFQPNYYINDSYSIFEKCTIQIRVQLSRIIIYIWPNLKFKLDIHIHTIQLYLINKNTFCIQSKFLYTTYSFLPNISRSFDCLKMGNFPNFKVF